MHSLQQRTENLDILSPVPVLLRTLRSNQELEKIGSGTESNVYGIGPNLALKIYSGRCYERMSSECLEFEDIAKHELEV